MWLHGRQNKMYNTPVLLDAQLLFNKCAELWGQLPVFIPTYCTNAGQGDDSTRLICAPKTHQLVWVDLDQHILMQRNRNVPNKYIIC